MLIAFSGLPATGKTAIARELARQLGAAYLRIDSIEQALRNSAAIAEDNLRLGRTVVADSVNPLTLTRDAWLEAANRARAGALEVEVQCSDPQEHRRRVEARTTDIPGLRLPAWSGVASREYHPWLRDHLAIDTAGRSVEQCVAIIREALSGVRATAGPDIVL
jgi:predicted kinase